MSPLAFSIVSLILAVALAVLEHPQVERKAPARRVLSLVGTLLAFSLISSGRGGLEWRSVELTEDGALLCGVAVLTFWTLIGLGFGSRTIADGLAAAAIAPLTLAVGAVWVVPHLLFLLCVFAAVAAERARSQPASGETLASLVALCLIAGGFVLAWADSEAWQMPATLSDPARWVVLGGLALAILEPTRSSARRSGPGAPLLVAAGFSLVPRLADGEPYAGVVILGLALAIGALCALRRAPEVAAASLPLLVLLGAGLLAPAGAVAAGIGAVLLASGTAAGRRAGDPFRAALIALAPLSVAFAALSLAAERSLGEASGPEADPAGWGLALGALVLGLSGCLWAAVARGRSAVPEPPDQVKYSVVALALGLLFLTAADPLTGVLPLGAGGGSVLLILIAATAGAAGTVFLAHREPATIPLDQASSEVKTEEGVERAPRWLWAGAVAAGLASSLAVGWLTFQGLRVGFL